MLIFKSKKGVGMGFLVGILIVLIAFFLIGGAITMFLSKAEPKEAEILCQNSIALRAMSQINVDTTLVGGEIKTIPVLCKTIDRKISGSRDDLIEQVAYSMARCWWMFGEGRYEEILAESDIDLIPSFFGFESLENSCFNCYNLLIDQDEIEGGPITAEEITRFLYGEQYPKVANTTYLNYIQNYGGPGAAIIVLEGATIQPRKAYGVSFAPKNKEEEGSSVWGVVKAVGGVVVVGVVGTVSVLCIAGTLGGCTPLGVTATVATATAVAAGGIATSASGLNTVAANMVKEREISSIFVMDLEASQEKCGSGDLAGE